MPPPPARPVHRSNFATRVDVSVRGAPVENLPGGACDLSLYMYLYAFARDVYTRRSGTAYLYTIFTEPDPTRIEPH